MQSRPATRLICGVDEAGRGPLAGPVFAAAVILDPDDPLEGLADSKKLTEKARGRLAPLIRERALSWAVASASVEEIDALNILQATLLAMRRAITALSLQPGEVLIDGTQCPRIALPVRAVMKGDSSVPAISAASILAKTARDAEMLRLHALHPEYGLGRHKGYPTAAHLAAAGVDTLLVDAQRSFGPVRDLLGEV